MLGTPDYLGVKMTTNEPLINSPPPAGFYSCVGPPSALETLFVK